MLAICLIMAIESILFLWFALSVDLQSLAPIDEQFYEDPVKEGDLDDDVVAERRAVLEMPECEVVFCTTDVGLETNNRCLFFCIGRIRSLQSSRGWAS